MSGGDAVGVAAVDAEAHERAEALGRELGLRLVPAEGPGLRLLAGPEGLVLARGDARLRVEWAPRSAPGRDPLVRAMGRRTRAVLDACAGFGDDSYALARAGLRVTAVERVPAVYALLRDAWSRRLAEGDEAAGRVQPRLGESAGLLAELAAAERPDAVYLDPMFPGGSRRRALPKLPLQLLQELAGDAGDAAELARAALEVAARVVIKRPRKGRPLLPGVDATYAGKQVRFDVYRGRVS